MHAQIIEAVTQVYRDRRWLVVSDALASVTSLCKRLDDLGATSVFALGATRGAGDLPDCPHALLDLPKEDTIIEAIRAALTAFKDVPASVRQAIDVWDPEGDARAMMPIWEDGHPTVAGRALWGRRQPRWVALEDTPVGPPTATRAAEVLGFLDREWRLGLGPLEAAKSVR